MYAKFCVNRETANNFMRLFVNRRAYAIQAERSLPNGSVPYYPARDWKTKEPKHLDEGVVRMHLNGDITISLYAINPENVPPSHGQEDAGRAHDGGQVLWRRSAGTRHR